jgi:MHS family proline/betaine transporter-like MFS transporter
MSQTSGNRTLLGGAIGNMGELFDYAIYALLAPTIALHFFPQANPIAALLNTFAVFAVSFVARPFGGVLFGYIGDKHGRLAVLAWTVVLMGAGTMSVGLLPDHESVGVLAPALLVVCRLLQGLSLGGETTGVESFIAESAPDGKRATWTATGMSFVSWGPVLVALVIVGIRSAMGDEAFTAWGWRIPFLLGGLVALIGYLLRRTLDDPDEFTEAAADQQQEAAARNDSGTDAAALGRSLRTRRSMLLVVLLQPPMAVGAFLLEGYMYSYLVTEGGLSATEALFTNSGAVITMALLLPVMGRLSDRFGRRPMYAAGAAWLFVTAYPAFLLAGSGSVVGALVGQMLIAVGVAIYTSALLVGLVELFPTAVRCRGHGISYNVAVAVFGGTTPFIAAALVAATGSPVAPALYAMAMIGTIGLAGILLVPETRNVNLRTSIYGDPAAGPEVTATAR